MSLWTYITGTITVSPLGCTQPEKRYILDTVLAHLPLVTGLPGNMNIYVNQKNGYDISSNCDEFGRRSNLGNGDDCGFGRCNFETQTQYIITVDAALEDKQFETALREFSKWLCRLSKRVLVDDVLVKIREFEKSIILQNTNDVYGEMFEIPAWGDTSRKPNWCEYLMCNQTLKL